MEYSWDSSKWERDPQASPFVCLGTVGDWKNQFSVGDSQRPDKIYQDRLSGTGLDSFILVRSIATGVDCHVLWT